MIKVLNKIGISKRLNKSILKNIIFFCRQTQIFMKNAFENRFYYCSGLNSYYFYLFDKTNIMFVINRRIKLPSEIKVNKKFFEAKEVISKVEVVNSLNLLGITLDNKPMLKPKKDDK